MLLFLDVMTKSVGLYGTAGGMRASSRGSAHLDGYMIYREMELRGWHASKGHMCLQNITWLRMMV